MTLEYNDEETVAIFWDYENCELPGSADAYSVAGGIRRIAHEYGLITAFRAYFEMTDLVSPRSIAIRSDLQSCGVSLIDCPHNGRKDVADKMILVDMLAHAMGSVPTTTIVLISGDRDFLYAISVLRLRKFRVILMAPSTVHASLRTQASAVYEWPRHILQADAMSVLGQSSVCERSPRANAGTAARTVANESGAVRTGLPTSPVPNASLPATPAVALQQPVVPPPPPSPLSPTYSRAGAPPSVLAASRIRTSSGPNTTSLCGSEVTPSTPPGLGKSWATVVGRSSLGEFNARDAQVSRGNESFSPPLPWRSSRTLAASASVFTPAGIANVEQAEKMTERPTASENNNIEKTKNDEDKLTTAEIASSGEQTVPAPTGLLPAFELTTPGFSQEMGSPPLRLAEYFYPDMGSPGAIFGTDTASTASDSLDSSAVAGLQVHPDIVIPTVVMIRLRKPAQKYKLLVRVLERERLQGNTRVVFSQLGSMLRHEHPSVYQRAGAEKLKDYIVMAEQDGIVLVGRTEWHSQNSGNQWVALHPTYHGKPPELVPQLLPAPPAEEINA